MQGERLRNLLEIVAWPTGRGMPSRSSYMSLTLGLEKQNVVIYSVHFVYIMRVGRYFDSEINCSFEKMLLH